MRNRAGVIGAAWIAVLASGGAIGAEQKGGAATNEVVVTATRERREAQEVPASVTVLTAADITRSGNMPLADSLRQVEGVQVRSITGNPADAEVSMRGFGENGFGRVLVLLDGVRVNRPDMAGINWTQFPLSQIERVEVVRGGGSALYGDNAVAGVINVITRRDMSQPFAQASVDYGSFDSLALRGSAGGGTERLAAEANAEYETSGGYRARSAFDAYGVGGSLRSDIGERNHVTLGGAWRESQSEMPGALTREQLEQDARQSVNPSDEVRAKYLNGYGDWRTALGESHEVDATLSYRRSDVKTDWPSLFSFSDAAVDSFGVLPKYTCRSPVFGHANTLQLGVDCYWDELRAERFADQDRTLKTIDATVDKTTLGGYGREEFAILPSLILGVGGRVERAEVDARATTNGVSVFDTGTDHDESAVEASLVKNFPSQSKLFARVGTVYRYPFVDELVSYYGYGADQFYADIQPEEGWYTDVGAEVRATPRVSVAATLFLVNLNDEIAYNSATMRNENLDQTRHQGVEAEVKVRPVDFCKLSANYTFTDATFASGPNEDKKIPLVAQDKGSGSVEILLPKGISFETVFTYVGDCFFGGDYANSKEELDDYGVVDLYLRYRPAWLPGLRAYVGVQNLFDEQYSAYGYYAGWEDKVYYYPSPGQSFKGGLAYTF